jgi:DNA-binding transcriptional ArsR family regulator
MGLSKTDIFSERHNRIAELAKALSHPARVAILEILADKKSCICGDIVEELPLAQATISQHLKELKRIGIIKGEITPPKVCYCLNDAVVEELKMFLGSTFEKLRKGCC